MKYPGHKPVVKAKNDERFADPKTETNPRAVETLRIGVGASDLNADNALIPADISGVTMATRMRPHRRVARPVSIPI